MPNGGERTLTELDYAVHINRALPDDIRVYAVVPAPASFSARFDCRERMYRYFFVRKTLDIEKMRLGAAKLVGTHDYRNFCRIDTSKHTFERKIRSFEILACEDHETKEPSQQMFRFEVSALTEVIGRERERERDKVADDCVNGSCGAVDLWPGIPLAPGALHGAGAVPHR
ncbi:hypothetical protein PINS_up002565 [Pythium insidiosum]|nr:hypothetical protein PINS_up002565 [Pythium insidiosum]